MRTHRQWAERLLGDIDRGDMPPLTLLRAFAQHHVELADHADRITESAARLVEDRAARIRTQEERIGSSPTAYHALLALSSDIRAGIHTDGSAGSRPVHLHADGDLYQMVAIVELRNDATEEWTEGIAYRALDGARADVLCVTSLQRWDDRFTPVPDPDV